MKRHPFNRYFAKHGHYPRVRLDNGEYRLLIEFAPGYVRIKTYPYGSEIYIVRSAWIQFLRRVIPLTKAWRQHPDHDVPAAMTAYLVQEREHADELRRQKRERKRTMADQQKADRQRQRWLAARARAAAKEADEDDEDEDDEDDD